MIPSMEARTDMAITHPDVALIFEGGAMRAAYTAAVVEALISAGINFPKAYGISAGAMLAACYVSRNPLRAHATFTEAPHVKGAGGLGPFLKGQGFYDLQVVFEGLAEKNAAEHNEWTFDFRTFHENPAGFHIEAFSMDDGVTQVWEKPDMRTLTDVMERVRASCSYPLFIDRTCVDGRRYVDGGMGTSHGICADAALKDGFTRLFVVCTQPKGYRMPEVSARKRAAYKLAYAKHPQVYEALIQRPQEYDRLLERLEDLEREGIAYVFRPQEMPVTYKTVSTAKLEEAYAEGLSQCARELPAWQAWLDA